MAVELFIRQDPATLPSSDELTSQNAERLALLKSTGFESVEKWEAKGEPQLYTASTLYPELTGSLEKVWRSFLPTVYRERYSYRYDAPPTQALQAIQTAEQLGCFSRIEIWTPEGNSFFGLVARTCKVMQHKLAELSSKIDPMAVGVVTDQRGVDHYFQIVRWGEALQSLTQIKRHVQKVNWMARLLFVVLPFLLGVIAVAGYINSIQQNGYGPTIGYTCLYGFVAAAVGLVGCMLYVAFADWRDYR
ncbi:MAG: hypothetical protein JWN38_892 [Candidatus Saccharibacteria bacterium]|nr:hypothetical protein [Candidatus Saccharibacteria bacterium]